MQQTLNFIAQADDNQLERLFTAVCDRYKVLRPELELSVLWLDKRIDPNEQLDRTIALLENMKTSSV